MIDKSLKAVLPEMRLVQNIGTKRLVLSSVSCSRAIYHRESVVHMVTRHAIDCPRR